MTDRPHFCADPDRDQIAKHADDDEWAAWQNHEDEDESAHLKGFRASPPAPNGAIDGGEQDEQPARSTPQAGPASSMIDRFEDMLDDWAAIHRVRLIVRLMERYADDFERNDALDVRARQFAYYAKKGLRL
jgi:hypothetical protein